jgi:CHAT domain-containing protein
MFLPLHAAGIYDVGQEECCSYYVVSSYTPTLTALLRAQRSVPTLSKFDVKLVLAAASKTAHSNMPTLWNVEDEMGHARTAAEEARISVDNIYVDASAVIAGVTHALKDANVVHIACHGTQNTEDALSSGFHLFDGTLTVSHLMDLDLKDAFFAFLSACETAKGDDNLPDQTVHLAATMLFVGFRSVVATMW